MTRSAGESAGPTPGELGLPEHSALTIEGRVERAGMVGSHLVRGRKGQERRLRTTDWSLGLATILIALIGMVAVFAVLYLLS